MDTTQATTWDPVAGADATWRLAVPGGWLYRYVYPPDKRAAGQVMCFVPDPRAEHVWLSSKPPIDPEGTART